MTPAALEAAKKQSWDIINTLPQRALVPPERIAKWIDTMAMREPDRLVWHATRQSGFSGSEVGTLVENARGRRAHFGSARKLVMQKLFMMTPDLPNQNMLRGIEMEDMHRVKFMKLWNATRDVEAYDALSNARGRYPFLRYSPDDVVKIQGNRVLVDYKSPSEVTDEEEYSFDYQCQINLGADIMNQIGLPPSHGLLSRLSWKEWKCVDVWVQIDPQLQDEIAETAYHYWTNHVLRGEPPAFVATQKAADLPPEMKQQLKLMSAQIVAIDEVASKLDAERKTLAAAMGALATSSESIGKTTVFCHDLKTTPEVNLDHFREVLLANDLDADAEFANVSIPEKYNTKRLIEHLIEGEFDLAPFVDTKMVVLDKVIERMNAMNIPADTVIDHVFSVKKTTRKIPDVLAFKPQFTSEGEVVKARLVAAALAGMGVTQAASESIADDPAEPVTAVEEVDEDESGLSLLIQ